MIWEKWKIIESDDIDRKIAIGTPISSLWDSTPTTNLIGVPAIQIWLQSESGAKQVTIHNL